MSEEERMLVDEIEQCRRKMVTLARDKPLFSMEVIEISQSLDTLLNRYDEITSYAI